MTLLLAALLWGSVAFLVIVGLMALSNAWALQPLVRYRLSAAAPQPFVSILLPARDEAANITACVRALLAQRWVAFEVLVLDDHSTDGTSALLAELANENPRLRVLRGRPLPPGWLGKHWACAQLAEAARGEVLLFTDADTRHAPGALAAAVAALQTTNADLISALPRQAMPTWGERLVVPTLGWSLFCFLPLALAHRLQSPVLSAAIGQFLLIRVAAYQRAGGHAAVRAHVADDLALTRRVLAGGGRWRLLDAGALVTCRMYTGWRSAAEGFSKNLYAAFNYQLVPFVAIWLWVGLAFTLPAAVLLAALVGAAWPASVLTPALLGAALGWGVWAGYALRLRAPFRLSFIYPAIVLTAVALALRSLALTRAGRATWKGRTLAAPRGKA
jgi:chlorobactene glucosyltransferase